ncbi:hypothetical protein [Paraburkholderia sediminicola]|uniref:hypothetical protein n=1 Tax=Paraburkholderia sediminicola TaxID=458836 RepID=UPI0038BCEF2F
MFRKLNNSVFLARAVLAILILAPSIAVSALAANHTRDFPLPGFFVALYLSVGAGRKGAGWPTSVEQALRRFCSGAVWPRTAWTEYLTSVESAREDIVHDVYINGIKIGVLSDLEWASIRAVALRDTSVHVKQVRNLLRVALRVVDSFYLAVPVGAFWILLAVAALYPELLSNLATAIGKEPLKAAHLAACTLFGLFIPLGVVFGLINAALGVKFGFANQYKKQRAALLRAHFGVPGDAEPFTLVERQAYAPVAQAR